MLSQWEEAFRTPRLEGVIRQVVIGEVVTAYTLVDEMLNMVICRFFFPRQRSFPQLWRTKRFRLFNHHVIECLYLPQKLRLVKAIRSVPKSVATDIERLCNLRNGLAHAFFPENLRASKPLYKGINIFTLEGISRLKEDMDRVSDFLLDIRELETD